MRDWRLSTPSGEIHIYRGGDTPASAERLTSGDAASRVQSWLETDRPTMLDAHDAVSVHVARFRPGSKGDSEARLVSELKEAFRRGELRAVAVAFTATALSLEKVEEPALGPETTTSEEAPKDFFEATLKDANGKAAAGIKYKLRTPDGQWREGKTDGGGKIRVDDIDRGYCELSFVP